ncbi:MAG: hypothetical protein ACI4TU_06965, partial [Candidatus Cryptobacteroides sp.]
VKAMSLLRDILPGLVISDNILPDIEKVYLLAQYKPVISDSNIGFDDEININDALPVMSKADFIKSLIHIFGASIFVDGSVLRLINTGSIINNDSCMCLDDKVSDEYSCAFEAGKNYTFSFADDSEENSYSGNPSDDGIPYANSYYDAIINNSESADESGYISVVHKPTGDIFSFKRSSFPGSNNNRYPSECVFKNVQNINWDYAKSDESLDYSSSFKLCRCIPERFIHPNSHKDFMISPILELPSRGNERGSDAIIGIINTNQMSDCGYEIARTDINSGIEKYQDIKVNFSLRPQMLGKYHLPIAGWAREDKQIVRTKLNIGIAELASMRMFHKVYFNGREWLIKKLEISINSTNGIKEVSGEFISV